MPAVLPQSEALLRRITYAGGPWCTAMTTKREAAVEEEEESMCRSGVWGSSDPTSGSRMSSAGSAFMYEVFITLLQISGLIQHYPLSPLAAITFSRPDLISRCKLVG